MQKKANDECKIVYIKFYSVLHITAEKDLCKSLQIFFLPFHTTPYLLAYIARVRVRCRSTLKMSRMIYPHISSILTCV